MQDAETFDRLWKGAQDAVRRTVARWGRGLRAEDREDAEAGARLRAWRSFPQFDPARASFVGWACLIARSAAVDAVRAARRGTVARTLDLSDEALSALFETAVDPSPSALDGLLWWETGREIETAMGGLTRRQEKALRLYAGGLTYEGVGAAMGTTTANVAHAAHEARRKLAVALAA